MDKEKKVMGPDLLNIVQGVVLFMEMDQPSKAPRVGCHDVVLSFFCFCGDVASIRNVLDSERRLQLNLISLFFKRAERLQFEHKVRGEIRGQLDSEGSQTTVRTSHRTREVIVRIYMFENHILAKENVAAQFST